MRRYRERNAASRDVTVRKSDTKNLKQRAEAEAEAEQTHSSSVGGSRKRSAPKPKRKPWRVVPEGWKPNRRHLEIAQQEGVNLGRELSKFRDHEFAKPRTDADAAFRTWLKRAAEFSKAHQAPPGLAQHRDQRRPEHIGAAMHVKRIEPEDDPEPWEGA
jgi:hypothetical protein